MKLRLEYNDKCEDATGLMLHPTDEGGDLFLICPDVGPEYWVFRVKLVKDQAIVAFPKFGLLGIGFAEEGENWNCNLPIDCRHTDEDFAEIWHHIKRNKKYPSITKKMVIEALKLIRKAYDRFGAPRSNEERFRAGSLEVPEVHSGRELVTAVRQDLAARQEKRERRASPRKPKSPKKLFRDMRKRRGEA
jgi:hypothetical protein